VVLLGDGALLVLGEAHERVLSLDGARHRRADPRHLTGALFERRQNGEE